ncbi:uncharacterized protein LOC125631499 [Caretta caretta]|uniref:uncharacterized protein LOC125631499 n=1 Tax=Caretta caretta TaxID=8467 RepID=UPI003F4C42D6
MSGARKGGGGWDPGAAGVRSGWARLPGGSRRGAQVRAVGAGAAAWGSKRTLNWKKLNCRLGENVMHYSDNTSHPRVHLTALACILGIYQLWEMSAFHHQWLFRKSIAACLTGM